ncbi:MAG TPA: hypothetical protein VNJ08_09335 [Bacteriovoracaceae bacterium]|nr:hypothetical protein [Bacteriovoracaceae bacterium]
MHVYYREYNLSPLRPANRGSPKGVKTGVHLKVKKRFTEHFADYFAHENLGDMPVELFLEKFKYQDHEYEKKIFHFLLDEERIRSRKIKPFKNHQSWQGKEAINSPVIKYKLQDYKDFSFMAALEKKVRVRLDANGLFNKDEIQTFIKQIPKDLLSFIDYLEDPMADLDWKDLSLPLARDFIKGDPYDFLIHKPNSRFLGETDKKVIFSSYMGSDLGLWHAYCELLEKGNLKEAHGIITPGLYQEQNFFFDTGHVPAAESIKILYDELSTPGWKLLCSI